MKSFKKILCLVLALIMLTTFIQLPQDKTYAKSDLPAAAQERLLNAIVLYVGSSEAYVNNERTQIDSSNPQVMPITVGGRVLVPARFISESLGVKVIWDGNTSTVTLVQKGKNIKMVLGSNKMRVNGKDTILEVPAQSINNRTYVPFRALIEALGKKVFYDRGLIIISNKEKIFDTNKEKALIDGIIEKVNVLPVVGSKEKLVQLMELQKPDGNRVDYIPIPRDISPNISMDAAEGIQSAIGDAGFNSKSSALSESSAKSLDNMAANSTNDYSSTNVQVKGVDEADVVKTDGKYIYQVNNNRIVIAEAYPADKMKVASILNFNETNFRPQEMYVDNKYMVVIGATNREVPLYKTYDDTVQKHIAPPYYNPSMVKAIVYSIEDRKKVKKLREIELEGNYVSSRKIGSALYMISNKYVNRYYMENSHDNLTPSYRDTAAGEDFKSIDYSRISYFPGCVMSNYMVIAGVDLDNNKKEANIYSYLGSGQNIYASTENLYVAVTSNQYNFVRPTVGADMIVESPVYRNYTLIYKFSINNSKVTYIGKGEVPGTILNQFSMDENDGFFRIATTTDEPWRSNRPGQSNNIYILNDTLSIVGKLEGMAPGERIYSVRFMGKKGYVVTFRQIDPLFVIDLTPESPKVLGELKIPGFSDYLHPYDETHIIGFGKDATDSGSIKGMKLALFDVSDVKNPKELFKEIIGESGTDSELLRNHKALLFSKEKNLLAFPVTVVTAKARNLEELISGYKTYRTYYQGAHVYSIDLKKGFELRAKITHRSDDENYEHDYYWYGDNKKIERLLYINDTLYTLSKAMFKAHDLGNMKEINTLEIKEQ